MRRLALALTIPALAACAGGPVRSPLPANLVDDASPGVTGHSEAPFIRAWGDTTSAEEQVIVGERYRELVRAKAAAEGVPVSLNFLALSGGGPAGAYSAGLLAGWTEEGSRPRFDTVTGISIGALIAPFVFAGPDYDATVKRLFTETATTAAPILAPLALLTGSLGLLDTAPLRQAIRNYVDDDLLARVVEEHESGRRLFIGTTNLDAGRPVIWNMGEIAKTGDTALFRDVMLASASIPGAFPPVSIPVVAGGARYDEFHVDGGVTHAVMVWPEGFDKAFRPEPSVPTKTTIYVIQNNSLKKPYVPVEPRLGSIASRSLSTIILVQSGDDLRTIAEAAERLGGEFKLSYVPAELDITSSTEFDVSAMTRLYDAAYADGLDGIDWLDAPPTPTP